MQISANDHPDEPEALAEYGPHLRKWHCHKGFRINMKCAET